jgi:Rrf2 family iron-sulfur cluster assembly transcriptional regulator
MRSRADCWTKLRGKREHANGGRLWIIVPRDEGVLQATRIVDGLPLVCDAQIYLDLLQAGLRGPDGACETRFVRDIAACSDVPPAYLAKLFTKPADAEIVESKRGWKGGCRLGRSAAEITLLQITEAIEGRQWMGKCLLGLEECSDLRACPTHEFWKAERAKIEAELRHTTLQMVIEFERARKARSAPAGRTRRNKKQK